MSAALDSPRAVQRPPKFNPFLPELRTDPYPVYAALREHNPRHQVLGMWVFTRYDDVFAVLKNRAFSSSLIPVQIEAQSRKYGRVDEPFERLARKSIVFTDNPDHHRLKKITSAFFGAAEIDALAPLMERLAGEFLAAGRRRGGMDFVEDYAERLPVSVLCQWMGIDLEHVASIRDWTHRIRFLLEPGLMVEGDFDSVSRALDAFMAFLASLCRERATAPGPDLISRLMRARAGSEALTDEEVIFVCIMCFVAGHETTKSLIANGIHTLLGHPDQYDWLVRHPERMDACIQECLRYESPLQFTKRVATTDCDVGGVVIRAGQHILLGLGAANRDEAVFRNADAFDPRRTETSHLAFGYGMHGCLGGALAERQFRHTLAQVIEGPALAPAGPATWQGESFIVRGLSSLPVEFR